MRFNCPADVKCYAHTQLTTSAALQGAVINLEKSKNILSNILLFDDTSLSTESNNFILNYTVEFLLESKTFEKPLFFN